MSPGPRFAALDGLRGLAAFAIVVFHYETLLAAANPLPGAYLAVDFFFLLSGFVLSHASGAALQQPGGPARFLRARALRLWPLPLMGLALFLAYAALRALVGQPLAEGADTLLVLALLGALFLPAPAGLSMMPGLYPLNLPAWSLTLEAAVNGAYGLLARRLTTPLLALLIGMGAAGMVAAALARGHLDQGMDWATLPGGVARVVFGFFAGVALHRAYAAGWRLPVALPFWGFALALLVVFALPLQGGARVAADLGASLLLFPLLLLGAAACPGAPGWACHGGRISFALYALHIPVLLLFLAAWRVMTGMDAALARPWSGLVALVVAVVAAHLATTLFDEPLRRALARRRPSPPRGVSLG